MPGTRKLNLPTDQRMALLRNMVTSLLENGKIETTETRAKEARKFVDKMISYDKDGSLVARRKVLVFFTQ